MQIMRLFILRGALQTHATQQCSILMIRQKNKVWHSRYAISPASLLTVGSVWYCYGGVEGQEYKEYTLTNFLVIIMKQRTNNCKANKYILK